ncbi:MAG: GGDEF domain-containing protein [Desulfurivibrionaceae bacterium]
MISTFFWPRPEKSAGHFFFLLVSLGLLSIGLILSLAMYGLGKTISQQVYLDAEDDAIHISQAILSLEMAALIRESSPGIRQVRIEEADMPAFDKRMRNFLGLFDIVKIKIYDDKHRVVYSTDKSIIGMLDKDNRRLARALAGFNDSTLKRKESLLDMAMEEKFDLDVVETYAPVSLEHGPVIGALEVYKDITRYRQTVISLGRKNVGILAAVLFLVFTPSMLIVRSLTIRLSILQEKLKEQASVDSLTGVLSRSEVLAQARDRVFRPNRRQNDSHEHAGSNGIIMLDIDHFKGVNDRYGHLVGDVVLKSLAQRIVTVLRQGDIIGRYGGEEFLVVLPESSMASTRYLGERIRRIIADNPFVCERIHLPVTVSVGISCFAGNNEQDFSLALEEADKAMYLAKKDGRNLVRWCALNMEAAPSYSC